MGAQAHIADFVEEKRAAVGLLKFADFVVDGAGEAAFDMAEKFGFDEFFGDGGAIDFDERAFVAEAGGVQRACDEFLAGAAFAVDQNAAVGGSGDGDLLAQRLHGNAVADDLIAVAEFGAQGLVFFFEAALLHGVADQDNNFFQAERFFDEVEGAEFGGADRGVDGGVAGNHNDRGRVGHGLDAAEGFEAVHAGEPDVEKNDVEAAVGRAFEGAFGGLGGFGDVAFVGEDGRKGFADAGFVVNDQDVRFGGHRVKARTCKAVKVQNTR